MLIRRIFVFTVVLALTLIVWNNRVDAHDPNDEKGNAERFLNSKKADVEEEIRILNKRREAMNALIGEWSANKAKIESGIELTFAGVFATSAAGVANYFAGGTLTATTKAAALLTLKKAVETGVAINAHGSYVEAMNTAINAVDEQLKRVEAMIGTKNSVYITNPGVNQYGKVPYHDAYNRYIKIVATHLGYEPAWLDTENNTSDSNYDEFPHSDPYITGKYTPAQRVGFTYSDLPYTHECEGPCDVMFRSPHQALTAHRTVCGDGTRDDVDVVSAQSMTSGGKYPASMLPHYEETGGNTMSVQDLLNNRTVEQGCGRSYYKCPSLPDHRDVQKHKVRTCKLKVIDKDGNEGACLDEQGNPLQYRKCMKWKRDHDLRPWRGGTKYHSDSGGDDSADAGDDSSSAMHACGIHATTVSGSHSQITPPCGDSAHAGYACQISSDHNTAMSGWSGPFYECQPHTTFPCGHTDPNANSAYHAYGTFPCGISTHIGYLCTAAAAASDALNHTLQASCLVTNANGDSCTVTNFYACQSHTHVYPAPTISCGRSGCTQTVTSSTQHSATCASGHSYWTCNPSDVYQHITRTCKYSACGKSWERCSTVGGTPICDLPWRKRKGWSCWW